MNQGFKLKLTSCHTQHNRHVDNKVIRVFFIKY